MPNGSINNGALNVLNRVRVTKAVWVSKILLTGSISAKVRNDAKAISIGAEHQTKY